MTSADAVPTSPYAPQPLKWHLGVALEAMAFFSMQDRDRALAVLGRTPPADGTFMPFNGSDFVQYLDRSGYTDVWPKIQHIGAVLDALVREGHLTRFPGKGMVTGVPGAFITVMGPTALQRDGDLWLAPTLGPTLVIGRVGGATIPISGISNKTGNESIGSGIALDGEHILTAAHVVNGMAVHDELLRPAVDSGLDAVPHPAGKLHVEQIVPHSKVDIAIIRVTGQSGARMDAADGLTWRDPNWGDEVTILGYPPVPTSFEARLVVQRGEIVTPSITTGSRQMFLFSAIARPGNSGGPVIGRDGRLLGVVTQDIHERASTAPNHDDSRDEVDKKTPVAPFYAGVPATTIAAALGDLGFGHLARLETWER